MDFDVVERARGHGDDVRVETGGDGAALFLDAEEFGGVRRHRFENFIGRDAGGAPDGEIVPGHIGAGFIGHFGDGVGGEGELHADFVGAGEAIDDVGADFVGVVVAGCFEMDRREIGAREKHSFFLHQAEQVVVEIPAVLDRIGAAHDDVASGLPAENVDGHGAICAVGFVGSGANFLFGVVIGAGIVGDELDEVCAVENIFANGFTDFFGAIGVDIFVAPDRSDFRGDMFSLSAERSDDFSGGENRGAGEPSAVNCVADIDRGVFRFISDVANGGDAGVEKNLEMSSGRRVRACLCPR